MVILVIPRTKHIASRIFDFPLPLSPVIELKLASLVKSILVPRMFLVAIVYHPDMTVRTAYDLKPCKRLDTCDDLLIPRLTSITTSTTLILAGGVVECD